MTKGCLENFLLHSAALIMIQISENSSTFAQVKIKKSIKKGSTYKT